MKRFFIIFAAMLLVSVSAFAQSKTPLKGDVNEDGVVDVADINAIIKIMKDGGGIGQETAYYYYAGWTLPTVDNVDEIINETYPTSSSDNTQHAAGKKTTNPSTFNLATVNLYNAKAITYYYVLVPPGHAIYDTVFGLQFGDDAFVSQGTITVGNQPHTIYKSTGTTRNIGSIAIRDSDAPTYYWYVGANASDNYITSSNYTSIASQVLSIPTSTNITVNDEYLYIIVPKEKVVTVYDENNFEINMKTYNSSTQSFTNAETYVGDYAIYRSAQTGFGTVRIMVN